MANQPLNAPVSHQLNSALGWLELGNADEAQREFKAIPKHLHGHPDVLILRWKILARSQDWEEAREVAIAFAQQAPERPTGWICLAYSLYSLGRNEDAWSQLIRASIKFPHISAIPYFLACLACQMGNTQEATRWLDRWNEMVGENALREAAREDPRLKAIWPHLKPGLFTEDEGGEAEEERLANSPQD